MSRARNGGLPAQRLGRRAWNAGRLADHIGQRVVALRDLQRRRRLLQRRTPQIVVALIRLVIAPVQLWSDHSPSNVVVWTVVLAAFLAGGIRDALDRRHLPRLDALLEARSPAPRLPLPAPAAS